MKTLMLISLLAGLEFGVSAQIQTNSFASIDIELARFVASQHVHRNYQPLKWQSLDCIVLHDTEGAINGYAFVFASAGADFRSAADLQGHVREKTAQLLAAKEKAATTTPELQANGPTPATVVDAEKDLYSFNDLATVITGATTDSPLVLRHFRGLPEFWVEAETSGSVAPMRPDEKTIQVSHVIMVTPMDFRLVAAGEDKAALRKPQRAIIPDSARVFKVHSQIAEPMSQVKQAAQQTEARKQRRLNSLKPADRQKYERALKDREKALAAEWQRYGDLSQQGQGEGRVTR